MSDEKIELSKEGKALITALEALNIVELNNVVKYMEQEYGISAAAPMMAMAAPAAGGAAGAPAAAEEKASYNVKIKSSGDKKIGVIKVVRELTQLGLAEAKKIVDENGMVKEGVPTAEAQEMKKKLVEAGAEIELL